MTVRRFGACVVLVAALVAVVAAQTAPDDKEFQAALQKEMVAGDLNGAIQDYRRIPTRPGATRSLVSQALLRLAHCYVKLGDNQARGVYQEIVSKYGDQAAAAEARERLAAVGANAPSSTGRDRHRVVWRTPDAVFLGKASRSGRYLPFATGIPMAISPFTTSRTIRTDG
jgi:hypothetical protein